MSKTLNEYTNQIITLLGGIEDLPVVYGTIEEQVKRDGATYPQFICVAPQSIPEAEYSDSQDFARADVEYEIGVYVSKAPGDGVDLARTLANDAIWTVHRTLRGLTVYGMQILLGSASRDEADVNVERWRLPMTLRIWENTTQCS